MKQCLPGPLGAYSFLSYTNAAISVTVSIELNYVLTTVMTVIPPIQKSHLRKDSRLS